MIPAQFRLLALVALVGAGFVAGWVSNGWRLGSKLAYQNAKHTETLRQITEQSAAKLAELTAERDAKQALITKIDLEHLKRAQAHEIELSSLRAAVDDGRKRLSVRANCPAMPHAAAGSGVAQPGQAELDPDARQAYYDLRAGIVSIESELRACKAIAVSIGR
jgi:hypothetical protein